MSRSPPRHSSCDKLTSVKDRFAACPNEITPERTDRKLESAELHLHVQNVEALVKASTKKVQASPVRSKEAIDSVEGEPQVDEPSEGDPDRSCLQDWRDRIAADSLARGGEQHNPDVLTS